MARHNEIGKIGEDLASKWLTSSGFTVVERNYSKKWGEIDIVAHETDRKIHFIEVKSVSYETKSDLEYAVTHETYRPEENVHRDKLKRLGRAIETWIIEHKYEGEWQIDVITVRIVPRERFVSVKLIENVILE
jgi:putative endonuclease